MGKGGKRGSQSQRSNMDILFLKCVQLTCRNNMKNENMNVCLCICSVYNIVAFYINNDKCIARTIMCVNRWQEALKVPIEHITFCVKDALHKCILLWHIVVYMNILRLYWSLSQIMFSRSSYCLCLTGTDGAEFSWAFCERWWNVNEMLLCSYCYLWHFNVFNKFLIIITAYRIKIHYK